MTARILELSPGLSDPVSEAQSCFRVLLDATARPGRILELPEGALKAIGRPPTGAGQQPISAATALMLLTLLDAETSVYLHGSLDDDALRAWLRFHTGVGSSTVRTAPAFTVARAHELGPALWHALELGSDEEPQRGTTVILEVQGLIDVTAAANAPAHSALRLTGPGIEDRQLLGVQGAEAEFWRHRITLQPAYPRGFDLFLVCGTRIAAVPRSTRVCLEH